MVGREGSTEKPRKKTGAFQPREKLPPKKGGLKKVFGQGREPGGKKTLRKKKNYSKSNPIPPDESG